MASKFQTDRIKKIENSCETNRQRINSVIGSQYVKKEEEYYNVKEGNNYSHKMKAWAICNQFHDNNNTFPSLHKQ